MKKNKVDLKKIIIDLYKEPKGKAILFFGFYLLFFIVLSIMAHTGDGTKNNEYYNLNNNSNYISVDLIENGNYKFLYTIEIDNSIFKYEGSKNKQVELFAFNNGEQFFSKDREFYKNVNGTWVEAENPYLYEEFLLIESISNIISDATYVSKTEYENGDKVYHLQLATVNIVKKTDGINIDIADLANDVFFYVDKEGKITKMVFNFGNYGLYKGICFNKFNITLEYFNYGEIENISIPVY